MFLPGNFCFIFYNRVKGRTVCAILDVDLHTHVHFEGEADKIRTWEEGDYDCTETSTYRIVRDFDVDYDKIPVDASKAMPDAMMDLVEPYKYEALESLMRSFFLVFRQKFMMKIKTLFSQEQRKRQINTARSILAAIT